MKRTRLKSRQQFRREIAKAVRLLREMGINTAPVPVELIAIRLGLQIQRVPLGDDISGVLVVQDGRGVIGVNHSHSQVRQRFTIAHEIGHFLLHRSTMQVFIDKQFSKTYFAAFRNSTSSSGEDKVEREANTFAANLLMPKSVIRQVLEDMGANISDEDTVNSLAERFEVSHQAMSFRIANVTMQDPTR